MLEDEFHENSTKVLYTDQKENEVTGWESSEETKESVGDSRSTSEPGPAQEKREMGEKYRPV